MFDFLKNKTIKNIETKAVNQQLVGNVSAILSNFPSSSILPSASVDILQYNRGYANACISLISKNLGELPFYLYRISNADSGTYLGKRLKVQDKQLIKRSRKEYASGDYTLEKVFEHPFLDLIEQDDEMSSVEFMSIMTAYLLSIGNAYIAVQRDGSGKIIKLKLLMSEYMSVKFDNQYNITSYVYQPALAGFQTVNYAPADIIHIKEKKAGSVIVGRGILEDALLSVGISEEAKKFTNSLLSNHMTPSQMITVKNAIKDEDEAQRIKDKFIEQFGGYNRGKSIVTFGDVDIKSTASTIKDEEVLQLCNYCKQEIAALFGVPTDLLDQSNSNRASILSAKANFKEMTVLPLASSICTQLSRFIAKEYDESFLFNFDVSEATENNPQEQATLYKTYIDAGIMTKEEVREKLGMEPLPVKETI